MKKILLVVIILSMLGWAVYEFAASSDHSNDQGQDTIDSNPIVEHEVGVHQGYIAPDFELTTIDGETVKLSDYRGQRVMLNFWGSWCPPCRVEMPDMQKFHENKDVAILAVNLLETESHPDNVQNFIDEFGLTFTIPIDEQTKVAEAYGAFTLPTSLMIDSDGLIQSRFTGPLNYDMMIQEWESMQ